MTENTQHRRRASKIDALPGEIKSTLSALLRDKRYSQREILKEINELINDAGLDELYCLSRSGLNRYAVRMEKIGERIRQSREIADMWVAKFGDTPQSDIGKLLMEAVKLMAFETTLNADESLTCDPKWLNQLALVASRIEQAQTLSEKRERELRADMLAQTEKALNEGENQGKSTSDILRELKTVYGVA